MWSRLYVFTTIPGNYALSSIPNFVWEMLSSNLVSSHWVWSDSEMKKIKIISFNILPYRSDFDYGHQKSERKTHFEMSSKWTSKSPRIPDFIDHVTRDMFTEPGLNAGTAFFLYPLGTCTKLFERPISSDILRIVYVLCELLIWRNRAHPKTCSAVTFKLLNLCTN